MILEKIIQQKRQVVEAEKKRIPLNMLLAQIDHKRNFLNFKEAIKNKKGLSIIAEVKKASPSKGIIREDFNPLEIAKEYEQCKVEAISVLTEEHFFQGNNQYLWEIRGQTNIPLLRKDFIIDPYQIYQSKVLGADGILLIVGALSSKELNLFQRIAKEINLQCLVEVHDQEELETALKLDADMIGINNRNLKTFETTLETTEKLMDKIPRGKIIVSESGIHSRRDMQTLEMLGVDGVLIGESLMGSSSIMEKLRELRGETG